MTREEHIAALEKYRDGIISGGISVLYDDLMIALDAAITALRGPQPDPETGLVPCGCGCKPELRDDGWGWYQVYCTGCDMHGGNSHTPDGVIEEWNTAMGWRVEG